MMLAVQKQYTEAWRGQMNRFWRSLHQQKHPKGPQAVAAGNAGATANASRNAHGANPHDASPYAAQATRMKAAPGQSTRQYHGYDAAGTHAYDPSGAHATPNPQMRATQQQHMHGSAQGHQQYMMYQTMSHPERCAAPATA